MKSLISLRRGLYLLAVVGLGLALAPKAWQADATTPTKWDASKLVKESNCKLCHGKDAMGNQWKSWEDGPHSKAYQALTTPKAKEIGAKVGVADPATSGSCLQCHSTAFAFTEKKATDMLTPEDGVTCQTCHGPAADYQAKAKHATNKAESIAKYGLLVPDEATTCSHCHNQKNPTYNPERYTTKDGKKVDFDYEQASAKIAHKLIKK